MSYLTEKFKVWQKNAKIKKKNREELKLHNKFAKFLKNVYEDEKFKTIMKIEDKDYQHYHLLKYLEGIDE